MFGVDIFQIDDGMFVGARVEEGSEVGAADGQDQLVGLEHLAATGERHVTQLLGAAQVLHYREKARVVIVPLEKKLFLRHFRAR